MNAIAMILQQTQAFNVMDRSESKTESSMFQALLGNEKDEAAHKPQGIIETDNKTLTTGLHPLVHIEDGIIEHFPDTLSIPLQELVKLSAIELSVGVPPVQNGETLACEPKGVSNKEDVNELLKIMGFPRIDTDQIIDEETLVNQLRGTIIGMESLLGQITDEQDIAKMAPKLLELLKQWSVLDKKSGSVKVTEHVFASTEKEETKAGKIVSELIQNFQKREKLVLNQQYQTSAEVTSKDVSKWLHKALNNNMQTQTEQVVGQQASINTSFPMSKLEQYVIHINENQTTQPPDKELVEQFQKVMKSSSFLAKPNGVNQLSITLRPNNLGEMMVRLIQIDGEMTVKITVTSHTAKQMLESNMHQLRNMFSPQQVVIERQELTSQQGADIQQEQKDQLLKDQEEKQSKHPDKQEDHHTDDDFAMQFHELLMNEKV